MRAVHVIEISLLGSLVAAAGACSSSNPDPVITHDSSIPDADVAATCLIKGDYGALGTVTGTAGTAGTAPVATTITVVLDPGPPGKDDLFIRLVPGKGVFAGGIAAGTYPIGGVDANFTTCGLCTNIVADVSNTGPAKFYYASSGTVTLTTVTAPITGTVQNLAFGEIDISTGAVNGPCTASITSASFTAN
jgi:hypothetical protein